MKAEILVTSCAMDSNSPRRGSCLPKMEKNSPTWLSQVSSLAVVCHETCEEPLSSTRCSDVFRGDLVEMFQEGNGVR